MTKQIGRIMDLHTSGENVTIILSPQELFELVGELIALLEEVIRLREVSREARTVMSLLSIHGADIVPHIIDSDDNCGQRLRDLLANLPHRPNDRSAV